MRISRSTGALSGVLIVLLGIWGGIVPFVGPYFNYAFGSDATWHYTTDRFWLSILPAVVVIAGGLILIRSGHRVGGALGAWLAIAGGGWFVVGPAVSRVWEHSGVPIGHPLYGAVRQMLELVGYFYGLGALIIGLAAFALGRYVTRPALIREPTPGGAAYREQSPAPTDVLESEPVASARPAENEPIPITTTTELKEPVIPGRRDS
jgi:hypothetical protein